MNSEQRKHFIARIDQIKQAKIAEINAGRPSFEAKEFTPPMSLGQAIIAGKVRLFNRQEVEKKLNDFKRKQVRRSSYCGRYDDGDVDETMFYDRDQWDKLCASHAAAEQAFDRAELLRKKKQDAPYDKKIDDVKRKYIDVYDNAILGGLTEALQALKEFESFKA